MKKNVASQIIGAQMVSATDGSAFTGTASVAVTVDGGTQGAGSGTGPTHEGNGFHTYIPTQAETNGDHVAFTFTGSGAIPVTVQIYTGFPQTGDGFARLGAPAGASIAADIAVVDGVADAILADTGTDGVVIASGQAVASVSGAVGSVTGNVGGNVTGSVGSVLGGINTSGGTITTLDALDTAQDAQHSTTQSAIGGLNDPTAAAIADAVWDEATSGHATAGSFGVAATDTLADTNELQTNQGDWATATGFSTHSAADVWAAATRTLTAGTNLNDISVADILTTQMTESYNADGSAPTLAQALHLIMAYLMERSVSGTTVTVKKLDGSTTAATFTLDDDTAPTSVTRAT